MRIKSTTPSVSYVLANEEAPSEECTLIVQHSPRALRIAIRETLSNHIRLLHEYETASEAETGVEQGDLFTHLQPVYTKAHITQCQLYVQTGHFALIPSELFDPTIGLRYLDMTANLPDGLTAASTNHGVFTNVFAVDTSLLIQLKNLHLPLTKICHQVDVQHVFAQNLVNDTDNTLTIQALVEDKWVSFYASQGGKTLLANAFLYQTADEFADACRHISQATQAPGEPLPILKLMGQIVQEGVLYKRVFPFFRQIEFAQWEISADALENLEPHRYFDLRYPVGTYSTTGTGI